MLVGALIATFVLSRLLLAGAKAWPTSYRKHIYVNVLSGLITLLLAVIGNSGAGRLIQPWLSAAVYGSAQCFVLLADLLRPRHSASMYPRLACPLGECPSGHGGVT